MPTAELRGRLDQVRRELHRYGVLPFTDSQVTSVVSIVVGTPVAGSWWGHPAGSLIYQVGEALDDDPDVVAVKLWKGKVTLIHRPLWPALVRIGRGRTSWQMDGLGEVAHLLLAHIEDEGAVRAVELPADFPAGSASFAPALRSLEARVLVLARSVHTSSGAHALEAESWTSWKARVGVPRFSASVESAQVSIERAAARLTPGADPGPLFPWGRPRARDHAIRTSSPTSARTRGRRG